MSKKEVTIEPRYIGEFIKWIALDTYHMYGGEHKDKSYEKMTPEEQADLQGTVKLVGEAITKGLLLAGRQPELADSQIRDLNSMQKGYADKLLSDMLKSYQDFLYYKTYVDKK